MTKRFSLQLAGLALFGVALAACAPAQEAELSDETVAELSAIGPAPENVGCGMRVETPWLDAGADYFIIADAVGENCAGAQLGLWIAGPGRSNLAGIGYQAFAIPQSFGDRASLAAINREDFAQALRAWSNANATGRPRHTSDLPPWDQAANQPLDAQFSLTTQQSFDRTRYEALRAMNLPTFCHEAEGGALKCHALRPDGELELVGLRYPRT